MPVKPKRSYKKKKIYKKKKQYCRIHDLRGLAVALCKMEGKRVQVNVAQMSEVIHCLRQLIRKHPMYVLRLLVK